MGARSIPSESGALINHNFTGGSVAMKLTLSDSSLLKDKCYVAGEWVGGDATIEVTTPADESLVGRVPKLGAAETRRAIEAARTAQKSWAKRTAKDRAGILRKWFNLMMENQDDLGMLMTAEQGKPLAEAKGEIAYGASFEIGRAHV